MVITYEESLDGVYVDFGFESQHRGILVCIVIVGEQEALASALLPERDACRLTEWLSRWSDQPFSTPEWTLQYVKDDPDLEFVLREGSMAGRSLWMCPFEVDPAVETPTKFLLSQGLLSVSF